MTRPPTLTLFCGLPGSGKSTLARRLEAAGRGVRLCTDEWQAALGVDHAELDLHERLQVVLYRHALALLRHGVDVILEDGLWRAAERAEKIADARACSARVELHIFDVGFDTLWGRLQERNHRAGAADHPLTQPGLRRAFDLFEPVSADELGGVDSFTRRSGGLGPL